MANEIDSLNRALRRSGQPVILRKVTGTTTQTFTDLPCLALVRGYTPQQLVGGILVQDSHVIISPTPINAATWPGPQTGSTDVRIPSKSRGDIVIIAGANRAVQTAVGIYIGTNLVRIEIQVR
jgi:hypothetical protein